jgi:hypothetical protein
MANMKYMISAITDGIVKRGFSELPNFAFRIDDRREF